MKKQSSTLTAILLSLTMLSLLSCSKNKPDEEVPLTKKEILTQKEWRVDQLHSVVDGVYGTYYRGGSNTTGVTYDNMRFMFNDDGTATYIDENGLSRSATWQFSSGDQRSIAITISGYPATDNWEMVEIQGNYLHATENFGSGSSKNNMHSFRLIQL